MRMDSIPVRQRVNLTVSSKVVEEAKALGINLSSVAETGIASAVKKAKEEKWLAKNWEAIQAYNREVEERGLLIPPIWEREDGAI